MNTQLRSTVRLAKRYPMPWDAKTVRDRVLRMIKRWGEVWVHASEDQRCAYASEVAFDFMTCRDGMALTSVDVRNLRTHILTHAGLLGD